MSCKKNLKKESYYLGMIAGIGGLEYLDKLIGGMDSMKMLN